MLLPTRHFPGLPLPLALTLLLALTPPCPAAPPLETLLAEHRYEEALADLLVRTEEWALEAKRNPSPETQLDWSRSLLSLGMVEDRLARYNTATEHLTAALALIEDANGPDSLRGDCLDALGLAASHSGNYPEAELHLQAAIAIRNTASAEEREPWLSASRDHLGLNYLEEGRYEESGKLFQQSLASTDPENDELMAQRLGYLARYYHTLHNYARARDLLTEALPHAETSWGRDHPNTLALLSQLGLTASRLGEPEQARAIMEEVTDLARQQATDTTGQLRLAGFLNILGSLNLLEGEPTAARSLFEESLHAVENTLGPDHLALAPLRNNLACTLQDLGDYAAAETYLRQTRDAYLKHMGPDHQRSVEALANLALNTLLQSGPAAARSQIAEASSAAAQVLERLIRFGSERQRLNYLQSVDLLSLSCSAGEDPGRIANTLLASKGRLLDVLLEEANREPSPALRKLRATQQKLDLLLLSATNPDEDRIAALRAELHALERQASPDSTPASSRPPTWQDVQATLPADSAFIDFVRYTDYTANRESRYGALLLLPTGPPAWIPLAGETDLQIWLAILSQRLDYRAAELANHDTPAPLIKLKPGLQQLHQQFWAPIEALLPATTRSLCLCPDASLNFLSFAVLLDDQDRFLAHRYPLCAYVSSGRDLLLPSRPAKLDAAPWQLFAVDSFAEAEAPTAHSAFHQDLAQTITILAPLEGAKREMELLHPFLAKGSHTHLGADANETTLRAIPPSPAVLHLVTHGFFLGDSQSTDHRLQDFDDDPRPLYRSGLVLYGAKQSIAATSSSPSGPSPTPPPPTTCADSTNWPRKPATSPRPPGRPSARAYKPWTPTTTPNSNSPSSPWAPSSSANARPSARPGSSPPPPPQPPIAPSTSPSASASSSPPPSTSSPTVNPPPKQLHHSLPPERRHSCRRAASRLRHTQPHPQPRAHQHSPPNFTAPFRQKCRNSLPPHSPTRPASSSITRFASSSSASSTIKRIPTLFINSNGANPALISSGINESIPTAPSNIFNSCACCSVPKFATVFIMTQPPSYPHPTILRPQCPRLSPITNNQQPATSNQ